MKYPVLIAALLCLGGCGVNSLVAGQEATVLVSIVYDDVPCARLLAERNALAREVGVANNTTVTFSTLSTGLAMFVPDFRSEKSRQRDSAVGKIMAMNDSLARRCGKDRRR